MNTVTSCLGLEKTQRNKDICDPLHRSLAKMTHHHINVTFQFPSCNNTGCDYARQAGDYFKGHPSPSLAFLFIVCDNGAVLSSAYLPVLGVVDP